MGFGFRYLLVRPDGEPADPREFHTAVSAWRAGDTFPVGHERTFRVVKVSDEEPPPEISGTLVVEPLD